MPNRAYIRPSSLVLTAASLCFPALAIGQGTRTLPDTRVTPGQSGPGLATSTISADDLEQLQVTSLEDFGLLQPNLHFVDSDSRGYGNIVTLRGASNTLFFSAPAVGLYVDDVPYADVFTYNSNLLRLDSATLHYGPQGARFGRNAPAGLIELTTMQPGEELRFGGSAEYGSYDSHGFSAYSSGPIADGLSHTLQLYYRERDGFVKNTFLGKETDDRSVIGGLASLIWSPSPDLEFKLRFAAEQVDDGSQRLTSLMSSNPFRVASNVEGESELDRYQLSFHARKDFDWGTVKSITSWQDYDLGPQIVDLDLMSFPFPSSFSSINQDQELWTQEFRFESPEGSGPLSWRGGLFYLNKDTSGDATRVFPDDPFAPAFMITDRTDFSIEEESFAAFANGSYDLGNGFSLEAGGRLEWVDVSMDRSKLRTPGLPIANQSPSEDEFYFSPTGGITYEINDKTTLFARTGLGIKPHGFSAFSDNPATASYDEERNWSNEVGIQFLCTDCNFNGVLRAFWNEIDDYQLNVQNPLSTDFVIVNADEVRARGIEAEVQWQPIDDLLLHGSFGWTDADFRDYTDPFTGAVHNGNNVPFIPDFTASAGFRYNLPGGFFVAANVRGADDTYYDAANSGAFMQDAYWIWGAQAGYEAENWSVTVFGRNLFDEEYYTFINPQIRAGSPGDPQIFGVRVDIDLW